MMFQEDYVAEIEQKLAELEKYHSLFEKSFQFQKVKPDIIQSLSSINILFVKLQFIQECDDFSPDDYLTLYNKYYHLTQKLWQSYTKYQIHDADNTLSPLLDQYKPYFPHLTFSRSPPSPSPPPSYCCII